MQTGRLDPRGSCEWEGTSEGARARVRARGRRAVEILGRAPLQLHRVHLHCDNAGVLKKVLKRQFSLFSKVNTVPRNGVHLHDRVDSDP